ncbi:MAG: hypothetical protein E7552_02905 [Ruminococcaceae bacterium]|nr:hypothetical protein [Oscillospiraceae bacterium]
MQREIIEQKKQRVRLSPAYASLHPPQAAVGNAPPAGALVRVSRRKNKNNIPNGMLFLLSMGYKKDIFAVFAYEFELSHFYLTTLK